MIRLAYRNWKLWFCVAGVQCVRTWPAAQRVLKEIQA